MIKNSYGSKTIQKYQSHFKKKTCHLNTTIIDTTLQ